MPASPDAYTITQPDGSQFEAYTVGDEFFNFEETEDGFVIGKAIQGYYTYLDEEGNPSGYYVRSPENRTETEQVFLSKLNRQNVVNALREKTPAMQMDPYEVPEFAKKTKFYVGGPQALPAINNLVKKDSITGLVVLVQFSDVKFKNDDSRALYDEYMNAEGTYSKYFNMGSVRKYFKDNSMGTFRPHFDVAGPITLDSSRNYYGPNSPLGDYSSYPKYEGARTGFIEAMKVLKQRGGIDFSKYDNDGDGLIDFVFFIYAGVGSNNSGVTDAIWPHAWSFSPSVQMSSNIRASRYACANEIDGKAYKSNKSTSVIGGIGTFIHEFSHVLGLLDLYDLNNTNVTKTLGSWSVMDQGNYNCPTNSDMVSNCAPPFYSSFEKLSLGWISPTELTARGEVRLDRIDSNYAYRVTHPTKNDEFFLLEYRTHRSWDVAQVKSGMLIYHVDYVDSAWTDKKINTVGSDEHQHVDLIEAVPTTAHSTTSRDPFPGSSKVTSFDGFTFYDGTNAGFSLTDIKESSDTTYVTFTIPGSSSSSSVASSSSAKFSSSSAKSSSSVTSSSSVVKSSSSSAKSSSSSAKSSSSQKEEVSSSSFEGESSSSEIEDSFIGGGSSSSAYKEEASSSSADESSSSTYYMSFSEEFSSSSQYDMALRPGDIAGLAQIHVLRNEVSVYVPQQGRKRVLFFSMTGNLLFAQSFTETNAQFQIPRNLWNTPFIISVEHNGRILTTRRH